MIKVFEAFSGIGTQAMALRNIGVEHEITATSEVDEFAILSYHAIHTAEVKVPEATEEEMQKYMEEKNIPLDNKGKRKKLTGKRLKDLYVASVANNNLGDISKIQSKEIPKVDLLTYSFPCTDISGAGLQKGLTKGSGTRSSLLWECERVIETVKPKYLLMENVKNLLSKKFKSDFETWLKLLENLGYTNFWQVLNAKDCGIPQSRERVFVVSILDCKTDYKFPEKEELKLVLRDMLEEKVDEKYYLSQEQVDRITFSTFESEKRRVQTKEYSDTLLARDYKDPKCVVVGGVGEKNFGKQYRQGNRIYDDELAACLHASPVGGAGGQSNLYLVPDKTTEPVVKRIGGIFDTDKRHQAGSIWDKEGLSPTLDTMQGGWRQPSITEELMDHDKVRVRKLTPKECWRLMGITDEDYEKASKVVSNSQLYKQAGNAIVVNVLEGIFKNLNLK